MYSVSLVISLFYSLYTKRRSPLETGHYFGGVFYKAGYNLNDMVSETFVYIFVQYMTTMYKNCFIVCFLLLNLKI